MRSFFLLCDIYFALVGQSDITICGGQRWVLEKKSVRSSIMIAIFKLFYTYLSFDIAYYRNVFLL